MDKTRPEPFSLSIWSVSIHSQLQQVHQILVRLHFHLCQVVNTNLMNWSDNQSVKENLVHRGALTCSVPITQSVLRRQDGKHFSEHDLTQAECLKAAAAAGWSQRGPIMLRRSDKHMEPAAAYFLSFVHHKSHSVLRKTLCSLHKHQEGHYLTSQ